MRELTALFVLFFSLNSFAGEHASLENKDGKRTTDTSTRKKTISPDEALVLAEELADLLQNETAVIFGEINYPPELGAHGEKNPEKADEIWTKSVYQGYDKLKILIEEGSLRPGDFQLIFLTKKTSGPTLSSTLFLNIESSLDEIRKHLKKVAPRETRDKQYKEIADREVAFRTKTGIRFSFANSEYEVAKKLLGGLEKIHDANAFEDRALLAISTSDGTNGLEDHLYDENEQHLVIHLGKDGSGLPEIPPVNEVTKASRGLQRKTGQLEQLHGIVIEGFPKETKSKEILGWYDKLLAVPGGKISKDSSVTQLIFGNPKPIRTLDGTLYLPQTSSVEQVAKWINEAPSKSDLETQIKKFEKKLSEVSKRLGNGVRLTWDFRHNNTKEDTEMVIDLVERMLANGYQLNPKIKDLSFTSKETPKFGQTVQYQEDDEGSVILGAGVNESQLVSGGFFSKAGEAPRAVASTRTQLKAPKGLSGVTVPGLPAGFVNNPMNWYAPGL